MPIRWIVRLLRSVRFRLALATSLAVAIVAILTIFGLRRSIHWAMSSEIDRGLVEDARELGLILQELGPQGLEPVSDELRRKATGHAQHRWFVRLWDEDEKILWQSELADEAPPSPATTPTPTPSRPSSHLLSIADYRIYRNAAPANPLSISYYEIGSSLDRVRADLERIDQQVFGAALLMLLASPVCGYLLAGLATREVSSMTQQAAGLRPTQLDERLPESGLDDEFDRLAKTINGLLDRIAEFIREKRTFLANAAHELRTPIAAIRSSIEVGLMADRSATEYRELLEQLIEDSESLEVLVNQVLLLSEAYALQDSPSAERVALSTMIERAAEMFSGVAEAGGITLETDIPPDITAHGLKRHLGHVVNNLIDNALKYTPPGGVVRITLRADNEQWIRLVVADTGIGIAEDDLPRIFDRFYRADPARRRDGTRGVGLGLSICKTIVETHRGHIECISRVGEGTRFVVSLPKAALG
ncbi:sensor histidine kinase [Botrimarina hoheduenensis]|uniref:histidine kinase n=1 Tax=Botrimarina hoheduenensis TaxID=2528000 RepID=A0A5C5VTC5_9BACT|nr:HAMP domain-containing sensor histidine kinase [Botrimarina hoheduenensis]TWT40752.1 Alkaline phosphatase synthesis sensor protein PhoR [Botrimarina hoheduenensis]